MSSRLVLNLRGLRRDDGEDADGDALSDHIYSGGGGGDRGVSAYYGYGVSRRDVRTPVSPDFDGTPSSPRYFTSGGHRLRQLPRRLSAGRQVVRSPRSPGGSTHVGFESDYASDDMEADKGGMSRSGSNSGSNTYELYQIGMTGIRVEVEVNVDGGVDPEVDPEGESSVEERFEGKAGFAV